MKKMSIGIMGTRGIPNRYGGFEQFAQYLSLGLVQRGHTVAVYTTEYFSGKTREWNGVQLIRCRNPESPLGTAGQFIYDLNCIRDAHTRNFDILLHLGYTSDAVWYWYWPRQVVNIMNMDGLEWKRTKYNAVTRRFLKWVEALAAKKSAILVADSPCIQEYLLQEHGKTAIYIPYAATVFTDPDISALAKYTLAPHQYFLLVARMEPENNIEMIIKGYLSSGHKHPLCVIGSTANRFGRYLKATYGRPGIRFIEGVYNPDELNNLRYYSLLYFHGHSVGGTNPSLLEAMACGCIIAAHDNVFNRAVLQSDATFFSTAEDIAAIINKPIDTTFAEQQKQGNREKIQTIYNLKKNISDYEQLMLNAWQEKQNRPF